MNPFPLSEKKLVCQTVVPGEGEGEGMQKHQCSYRWPVQEQAGQEGRLEERLFNKLSGAQHCWAQWLKWSRKLRKCRKQKTVWEKLNYYLEALRPYQVSSTLTNIRVKSSFIFIDWKKKKKIDHVGDVPAPPSVIETWLTNVRQRFRYSWQILIQ